ncbi:DUF456 domain-containing protein [Alkalicoccobacillus porphyridii]|uniref:DUF456 domain-containing protein n=1 Tax=Alkalicoccobacillus porphyridii TaxID=2597270 RepID=A0A553ZU29_9BACI|nr:DUF456 domain-containing protein [Alkalicoccobacillus porphyridii]TSB44962.1 DUF456 domain-containing protein [Alkalicoccobacillus porphyridii]
MDIIWWILIAVCFILGYAGLIFPIVPSVLVLWIGFFIYQFGVTDGSLSWLFWTAAVILTVVLIVADLLASRYFVKKYGGSAWGERAAMVGVIVGSFVIPPFGIIVVPFVLVLIIELYLQRDFERAVKIAFASFLAFLSGTVAKAIIQTVLIIWFFLEAFLF